MINRGQVPRLLRTVFAKENLFRFGLVVEKNERDEEILSESAGLNPNYIRDLRTAAPRLPGATDPKTLLYLILRHSSLLEHGRAVLSILKERGLVKDLELYEREMVNVTTKTRTIFELMDQRIPGLTGNATLAEHLARPLVSPVTPAENMVADYANALLALEALPTAELERLFTETLDVCAYRLDAWTTSLATQRLQAMRAVRPRNAYVGAYGWVENLKPVPGDERRDVPIEGETGVNAHTYNGGYVYAPSMTHGAAAAVLRNAYMTRAGEQQSPYAIDLSSARVRAALLLLDTVREGQPLGASLGYLFERGLHDHGLDRFIDDFREKYRLGSTPTTAASNEPAESIAARNVVDGYALLVDFNHKPNATHWAGLTLSPQDTNATGEVDAVLATVDNALDALADLLTAESVFQLVGGSVEGAGATLDAMAKGAHAPEPEIANRARGGIGVTHRVALVLGDAAAPLWAGVPATPRADTEPRLNAWVGQRLGDPAGVACWVSFSNGARQRVTLRDLELRPLDVLTLAREDSGADSVHSELDRRVADAALRLVGVGASQPVIRYDVPADELLPATHTFPEILEIAHAINKLLGLARALEPADLLLPGTSSDVMAQGADLRTAELQMRANLALDRLTAAITGLEQVIPAVSGGAAIAIAGLRSALRAASLLGVAGAFPPLLDAGLETIARSVVGELRERRDRAAAAADPVTCVREVFGRNFVFLPRFLPARRGELARALNQAPSLGPDADGTVWTWFAKAARVRPPLGAWRMLSLYAGATGRPAAAPQIVQLPFNPAARWIGLPFGPLPADRPRAGQLSLALLWDEAPVADGAWSGLLLDEWLEQIPNASEDAGVVFHYDRPNTEAPQAVLVAVTPDAAQPWSLDLLMRTVESTLDLAKTRGFDGEWRRSTGELDHALYNNPWLPLILLAEGDPESTISTAFGPAVSGGPSP